MNTVVHIHANHVERYLGYAVICAHSLITNGQVPPQRIHVLFSSKWARSEDAKALKAMGVNLELRSQDNILGKFVQIDEYFRDFGADLICKLDADTILLEKCDFLGYMDHLLGAGLYGCYLNPHPQPAMIQQNRFGLIHIPAISPKTEYGRVRLNNMLRALFNTDSLVYADWLRSQKNWWYGGLILVNQSLMMLPLWRSLVAMSGLTACDETCIALSRSVEHKLWGDFRALNKDEFPHDVNPPNLQEYVQNNRRGMVHYAGEWYRHDKESNRRFLADTLEAVKAEVL